MKSIIRKYLRGETTDTEEKRLYHWIHEKKANLDVFKEEITFYMLEDTEVDKQEVQQAYEEFCGRIEQVPKKPVLVQFVQRYYKYAAIIAILISGVLFVIYPPMESEREVVGAEQESNPQNVMETQIVWTRGDGSTKVIGHSEEQLSFVDSLAREDLPMNEVRVPKGEIFKILLSDGTIVWLNSKTKLKFPTVFNGQVDSRTVWLEGEAYFDVSPNKSKPFIVSTDGVDVKVLGTKFNVSSYAEDAIIHTTLVEGAVQVQNSVDSSDSILLSPDFQATLRKGSAKLASRKVNTAEYTAWTQRRIIFNNTSFKELIVRIERTYNVRVVNQNTALDEEKFTGEFDIENIETVFKALSASIPFEYKIDNNVITIKN